MLKFRKVYDISVSYGREAIDYPGDPPFSRTLRLNQDAGDPATVSVLSMSCHSGTHLDLPSHFVRAGKTITDYGPEAFIMKAHVAEVNGAACIRKEHVLPVRFRRGEAVLFKTENSIQGKVIQGIFSEDFVYISQEAAVHLAQNRAGLVGIDYSTVEQHGDDSYGVHRTLLSNGTLILEGINLDGVPEGKYTLMCLPLKIEGGEASPVRAVLLQ